MGINPERDLIARIRAGDRRVLGQLFRRYERMVGSYIRNHGGDRADADDMLQEAIIILWQNVCSDQLQLTARIGTYLLGIVKNKWRAELRRRQRFSGDAAPESLHAPDQSALTRISQAESHQWVKAGLDRINPTCRELLMLFYFEGRSMAEIAGLMGFAGPDVAKAKKYQCKKALENVLAQMTTAKEGTP